MGNKPVQVLFPERAVEMIAGAATAKGGLTSQYVRNAVYDSLRRDGFDPTGAPRSAGETWVVGGRELPVVYQDSQPFDPDKHYRLAPEATVEADRVVRTYPVILKEEDIG